MVHELIHCLKPFPLLDYTFIWGGPEKGWLNKEAAKAGFHPSEAERGKI
jgi:hypothetical protein